jgi:FtsP/CotA-like multicopper oxidase with cupredoxin domain
MPGDSITKSSRRGFLAVGSGALFCTIAGQRLSLDDAGDAAKADAAAARVRPPPARPATAPGAAAQDRLTFATPSPQPGGMVREYWVQARRMRWDIVPTGRDQWHGQPLSGASAFGAFAYQRMTAGFAEPAGPAQMPGPTLTAEVGDVLVVHFRNAETKVRQGITMHPHGVRYNPEYDGVFLGDFTRAGGYVGPGEEFTYTWEATPDSVGVWPYHDHGPNHTLNTFRGLFGAIIVRPKGEKAPDNEHILFLHALTPGITGLEKPFQCINGRAYAGNTPTLTAKAGEDVAIHVIGMDDSFHDFHIHGHRWRDSSGSFVDTPAVGPNETVTARFVEDNPGRWLYHCHVFSHQDGGMAGWYLVEP